MRTVKGFVVLAIVLLVPTVGYFQKQLFENRMRPELHNAVMEILKEEEVEAPVVRLSYLDAVIGGRVRSDEQRAAVAARVDGLRGVRVPPNGNQLHTYGWIEISRADGVYRGKGVVPRDVVVNLPPSLGAPLGWDDELERRSAVQEPSGALDWGEFLRYYFKEPGDRSVELREGALVMRGDATMGLRSDWRSKASEVVSRDDVADKFRLYPSLFHFPNYQPVSLRDDTKLEQLRRQFGAALFSFVAAGEGSDLPPEEMEKVDAAARAIISAGDGVRFIVGGHPGREGNATANGQLARKRALAVVRLLEERGVTRDQLEVVGFGATPDGGRENEVEILVK